MYFNLTTLRVFFPLLCALESIRTQQFTLVRTLIPLLHQLKAQVLSFLGRIVEKINTSFLNLSGAYDEEESAARAYDLAALKYWGTSTFTNFPVHIC